MKRFFTLHVVSTLVLLLIASNALIAGIKAGVLDVAGAAFVPVAVFAIIFSYLFGSAKISPRRAWIMLILGGLFVIYIEAARINEPIIETIKGTPSFEFESIRSLIKKETPDLSFLQLQFAEITKRSAAFFSHLFSGDAKDPTVREVVWDIPILLVCAWGGWWTGSRKQIAAALAPSFALHGWIVYYTGKGMLSLQIGIFALILLMGIHQNWNDGPPKSEKTQRTLQETYSTVLIFSFLLSLVAGFAPSISIRDVTKKLTEKNGLAKSLGLDREASQSYAISVMPREHLVGLNPSTSQRIIFKVKTGEIILRSEEGALQTAPRHYWRWLVYDNYTGHGWTTSAAKDASYPANSYLFTFRNEQYKVIHQKVEKMFPQDNHLYWTGALVHADRPFESAWRVSPESLRPNTNPLLEIDMLGSLVNSQTYSADSLVPIISQEELRASPLNYPPDIYKRYLPLPSTVPQRVLQLAKDLTQNLNNPYDKAKAIEGYLRTFPYSLDVPPPPSDKDVADYFIFDIKTGYCDYYATSMVVLARAVGLPARLVIGYASGSYDPVNSEYDVHEADAHSWVEVYFTGVGWVEFEPTANQPLTALLEKFPQQEAQTISPGSARDQITYTKRGFVPQKNPIPAALGIVVIISLSGLWLRSQGLLKSHDTIGSIYGYIYHHGKKIYRNAPLSETPSIFADKLKEKLQAGYQLLNPAPVEIDFITRLYLQETYSAHPIARDERNKAIRIWMKLFWRLLFARAVRLK